MIEIDKLKREDIGRGVVYKSKAPNCPAEDGFVSSWNPWFVFVRFGSSSKACRPEDLEWLGG